MICKVCNATLRPSDTVCPHCGAAVPRREGGVGFWDMLDGHDGKGGQDVGTGGSRAARTQVGTDTQAVARLSSEVMDLSQRLGRARRLSAVCAAFGAVCLTGAIVAGIFSARSASEANALKGQVDALATQVDTLEMTLSGVRLEMTELTEELVNEQADEDVAVSETGVHFAKPQDVEDPPTKVPFAGFSTTDPFPGFVNGD